MWMRILIKIIHINRTIVFMWRDHADNSSNPHEQLVAACTTYSSVKQFAIPAIASMCPKVFIRTWPNQTCWPKKKKKQKKCVFQLTLSINESVAVCNSKCDNVIGKTELNLQDTLLILCADFLFLFYLLNLINSICYLNGYKSKTLGVKSIRKRWAPWGHDGLSPHWIQI